MGGGGGEGQDGRVSPIQRSPGDVQSTGGERQAEKKRRSRDAPDTPPLLVGTPEILMRSDPTSWTAILDIIT
jgi:hypothetical protein